MVKTKEMRKNLSSRQKTQIIDSYHNKCAICKRSFYKKERIDLDHIEELRYNGTNDLSNFQPLCVACHKLKTNEKKNFNTYLYENLHYYVNLPIHNPFRFLDRSDPEYINEYNIVEITNKILPALSPQKLIQLLVTLLDWISSIFQRIQRAESENRDIEKLIPFLKYLRIDPLHRYNKSIKKELLHYSYLIGEPPSTKDMFFWIKDTLDKLENRQGHFSFNHFEDKLGIIENDRIIREKIQRWLIKCFYDSDHLMELIMDNLTHKYNFFTSNMILSHEIFKTVQPLGASDNINLSRWLYRYTLFHNKYERIGYALETGKVIYIRKGQYDHIKDKIPFILFESPEKNFGRNIKQ